MSLVGWFALVAGFALVTASFLLASRSTRQHTWREVAGVIVRSEVVNQYDYFQPDIRFDYVVDGSQYSGATVRSGLVTYNWRGPAQRLCAKYPVGARVPVFVSGGDPASAVLEPGGGPHVNPVVLAMSVLLMVLGTILVFTAR